MEYGYHTFHIPVMGTGLQGTSIRTWARRPTRQATPTASASFLGTLSSRRHWNTFSLARSTVVATCMFQTPSLIKKFGKPYLFNPFAADK